MDVEEAIRTRLSVREFTDEPVDHVTQEAILDAARLSQTGHNTQHWRFVVVEDRDALREFAETSVTGDWLDDTAFVIVVTTDSSQVGDYVDSARAITVMQLAAWNRGIGSCICTGFDTEVVRDRLEVPDSRAIPAMSGFGHPPFDVSSISGEKDRLPLESIAFRERFGQSFR